MLWTKTKQNAEARRAGFTRKRYKGLDKAPHYVSPTLTYNFHRDYSFKQDHLVSLLTLGGRIVVPSSGYDKHVTFLHKGARIGAARLWYDKPHKQFYVLVSLEIDVPEPDPATQSDIVGLMWVSAPWP